MCILNVFYCQFEGVFFSGLSRLVDIGNSETVQSMLQGITQGNLSLKNMQKASANDDHDEGELTSRGSGSSTEEGLTSRECGSSTEEGSSSLEEGTENIIVLAQDQHGNIRIPDPGSTGEGNMVQNENSYVLQYFDLGKCYNLL